METEKRPGDAGEIKNGSLAASAPNISPSKMRLFRYSEDEKYFFGLSIKFAIIGGLIVLLSHFLLRDLLNLNVLGWIGIVLGAIPILLGLGLLTLCTVGVFHKSMCFKNGLLSTGIVQSINPVTVLYMANISTGMGANLHGLKLVEHKRYPGKPQEGDEIPAVSVFQGEGFQQTWDTFVPTPIAFGTGNKRSISDIHDALHRGDFEVMRRCIAQSIIPKTTTELVIIEEDGTYVETRHEEDKSDNQTA